MSSVRLPEKYAQSKHSNRHSKTLKRKRETETLTALEKRLSDFDPKSAKAFSDLPLTLQTLSGLHKAHFTILTDIQRKSLPLALRGLDVLGAAKTGSGKTLAFLIPVLEILFRRKWSALDGVGALIISPTRELATQIFNVLRKIGSAHAFSAGLLIGGKDAKQEAEALHRMNIVVCTPGRMLHHMDQTFGLNLENLQLLVLDEADRCLDMGFKKTLDAIVANLPKRQTLLFSATQTKNVGDLARLSLNEPEYVAVHEAAAASTPSKLEQYYMVVQLNEKLDVLYSFLKNHLKSKIMVFFSSGKQVRFVYETFRQMQPGIPLLHIHGRQKQTARAEITQRFARGRESVLFATDVVARGLDFPTVDWVLQADVPEDADTYIHRVGRTARFEKHGKALLFLCPSEEQGFIARLAAKKVPINKVNAKGSKKKSISHELQNLCFKDPELKYLGQKAFVSYARSILVQKDREVFRIKEYPLEEYASAMGLPGAPRIKGLKKVDVERVKELKNLPRGLKRLEFGSDEDICDGEDAPKKKEKEKKTKTKFEKMRDRQNQTILSEHYRAIQGDSDSTAESDTEFLTVRRRLSLSPSAPSSGLTISTTPPKDSKRRAKLATSRKELAKRAPRGSKLVFDDTGAAHAIYELVNEAAFKSEGKPEELRERFVEGERERVKVADKEDREVVRERRRERKRKVKERERVEKIGIEEEFREVVLPDEWIESAGGEKKRERKCFEDESEEEEDGERKKRKKGKVAMEEVPETLEDMEKLVESML